MANCPLDGKVLQVVQHPYRFFCEECGNNFYEWGNLMTLIPKEYIRDSLNALPDEERDFIKTESSPDIISLERTVDGKLKIKYKV